MGFLEFLNNKQTFNDNMVSTRGDVEIKRLSNLGAIGFGPGISDKKAIRTPHYEINKSLEMFELNTLVNSAVNQLVSFVIPNKRIKISSKDKATVQWLEEWHKQRRTIVEEFKNLLTTRILTGNSIIETLRDEAGKLDNVFSYNDVSRVYVNPDVSEDGHDAFILQLPIGMKEFSYRGKERKLTFYQVRYIKNYEFVMKRVYGCLISNSEFLHFKAGWSRDNIYGRSQLTSAIDADNIFKELISTWDTVIKTRRKDIKIYSVADAETGKRYTQSQLDKLTDKLQDTASSFKLINIPLKLNETEIKTTGTYDLFEGVFDVIRRMIIMALLPQHLTPWGDSATTQGSDSAMPPFILRIKALQNEFIHFLDDAVIGNLRKDNPMLAEDATYVFDEPLLQGAEVYIRNITDLVSNNLLTAEQGKMILSKLGIIDETIIDEQKNVGVVAGNSSKNEDVLISYEEFKKKQKVRRESL